VIEAGLTDPLDNWRALQNRIAQVTRVITYNRAGYGRSEPGPLPRHGGREAEELKALLDAASIPGPYVIVGHSLGGLNAQVFAAKYSEDVVGIVLLDPPPLSFIRGEEEEYQRYWIEQSRSLSHKSSNGKFVVAEDSTHRLYEDVPDLVVESILSVVYEAREAR